VGFRHFKEGVSKLQRCTGREHREMQRHIACIAADATDPEIRIAIRSMADFRYLGQDRDFNEVILDEISSSLSHFHTHKQQLLEAGARPSKKEPNWYIPKLEFMQSVVKSITESGAPMQWSADPTVKAHGTHIKQPARERTNNREYEPQIVRHLDRQEKLHLFDLATSIRESEVDLYEFFYSVQV
jgi:hypothetical protein